MSSTIEEKAHPTFLKEKLSYPTISFYSGETFQSLESEFDILQEGEVVLKKEFETNKCKKCYGRGYQGYDHQRNYYIPCSCINKFVLKIGKSTNNNELYLRGISLKLP